MPRQFRENQSVSLTSWRHLFRDQFQVDLECEIMVEESCSAGLLRLGSSFIDRREGEGKSVIYTAMALMKPWKKTPKIFVVHWAGPIR